jgi:hypothetical protein
MFTNFISAVDDILTQVLKTVSYTLVSVSALVYLFEHQPTLFYITSALVSGGQ